MTPRSAAGTPRLDPPALRRIRMDDRFRAAVAAADTDEQWRQRAACLRFDPDLFFPQAAEDPGPALAVCRSCPVQGACLAAALTVGECDGVWGATTPEERRKMRPAWAARRNVRH